MERYFLIVSSYSDTQIYAVKKFSVFSVYLTLIGFGLGSSWKPYKPDF